MKKFKIWNTVEKCFYTQKHKHTFCITLEGKVACWDECQGWSDSWFERYVPLQSSELLDSLGNEIYEGDIINIDGELYTVKFALGCFVAILNSDSDISICAYNWHLEETTLVGNIYEKGFK